MTIKDFEIKNSKLNGLLEEFFNSLDVSEGTIRTYREGLKSFFRWRKRMKYQGEIDQSQVQNYKKWLKESKSANTTSTYIVSLRRFLGFCVSVGKLATNPAENVRGVKRIRGHLKSDLSKQEIRKLFKSINRSTKIGKRDFAMVNLMVRCGLRLIELKRADVGDMEARNKRSILWIRGKGRDEKEEFVVLTQPSLEAVYDYLDTRLEKLSKESPLFVGAGGKNRGERLTTRTIRRRVTKYLCEAGLKSDRITSHSLRHSFVTLAIEGGATIEKTRAAARHRSIATTQVYFHEHDRLKEPVEDKIDV